MKGCYMENMKSSLSSHPLLIVSYLLIEENPILCRGRYQKGGIETGPGVALRSLAVSRDAISLPGAPQIAKLCFQSQLWSDG